MTEERLSKLRRVVSYRQKDFTVVIENVHDPHNVSAILRSVDAVGVDRVFLIYNTNKFPKLGMVSSASAKKWIELVKFQTPADCFAALREEGFKIYSTHMSEEYKNKSLYELDLTQKVALVFGNERDGVSEEAVKLSDDNFLIPMYGMVQSLNVSVSAAVCLYEALRQREKAGLYEKSSYTGDELKLKLKDYSER